MLYLGKKKVFFIFRPVYNYILLIPSVLFTVSLIIMTNPIDWQK